MGRVAIGDIEIYYELHGQGDPLVLIAGLGYGSWLWWKQVPVLAQHFQVVAFDNRGSGQSDKPDIPYSIRLFADDLAALLSTLHIEQASLFGISLGGFIAQEFALTYPQRTKRLILGATSFGGPRALPPRPEVMQTFMQRAQGQLADVEAALRQTMSAEHLAAHPEDGRIILEHGRANPQPLHAYLRQLMAPAGWSSEERLAGLKVPTLIMHGTLDLGSPVENAHMLAAAIPGSILRIYTGAGHLFFLERPDEVNQEIIAFMEDTVE